MIKCTSCEKPLDEVDVGVYDKANRPWCRECMKHVLSTVQQVPQRLRFKNEREKKPI